MIFTMMVIATPMLAWMWLTDQIHNRAFRNNTRRHFSRPSFSARVDENGKLHIRGGPNPDHAQRTQNSMRDWRKVERRLKWLPWLWFLLLVLMGCWSL